MGEIRPKECEPRELTKDQLEGAVVKGAPECGFFYPNVTSVPDLAAGRQTPLLLLGQQADWHPYQPTGCRTAAALSSLSAEARSLHCTNAHTLFPHLRRPLFFRENQFDISKLGNCGWRPDNREYLVRWGEWMRSQLATVRASSVDHVRAGLCDLCRDVWLQRLTCVCLATSRGSSARRVCSTAATLASRARPLSTA